MREPTYFTRKELYDLVWARPMIKVAADLGISDVALKKICVKHRIPVPLQGYWNKVQAGHRVGKTLLHTVSDPLIENVAIYGSPERHLPPLVRQAKRAAVIEEKKPDNRVVVANRIDPANPLVVRTMKALMTAKADAQGLVSVAGSDLITVSVGPASVNRAVSILEALINAAQSRGYEFKGEKRCRIDVSGEQVGFSLTERSVRKSHVLMPDEVERLRKFEEQRERAVRLGRWDAMHSLDRPKFPEWDYAPTGALALQLDELYHSGLRRTWADGKTQRLEDLLNDFLSGVVAYAAASKARHEEQERREREWREEERRRLRAQRWRERENRRVEFTEEFVEAWEEADRIEQFTAVVERKLQEEGLANDGELRPMVDWLRRRISRLRSATAPTRIKEALASNAELFLRDADLD